MSLLAKVLDKKFKITLSDFLWTKKYLFEKLFEHLTMLIKTTYGTVFSKLIWFLKIQRSNEFHEYLI